METLFAISDAVSGFLWNYLFLFLIVGGGIFLSIRLGFFQIRHFPYIAKQTFGKILDKGKGEGTVSPFHATATALASTIGASNIVGVPAAIAFGGPGALFWMWVVFIIGGATKFCEGVLGIYYRHKNAEGHYIGGVAYYMVKGLPFKKLMKVIAMIVVCVEMVYYFPSIATQSVSLIQNAEAIGINKYISAIILMILVGAVVLGGLIRVSKVASKIVPIMCILYFAGALIVFFANIGNVLPSLALVFQSAFTGTAAVGGFLGAGVGMAIRMGIARATYSCEAGMGSASIAYAPAITDHPVRQGLWGVFEVFVDGTVCTLSGLVVLASGVWKEVSPDMATTMPAAAFSKVLGPAGYYIVTISIFLFVFSTIIAIIWYGEKQVEFFFGGNIVLAKVSRIVYVLAIMLGAIGGLELILAVLDLFNGIIIIPNMITLLILSPLVVKLTNEYFSGKDYYLKDIGK
jgi:AGCS family alanine or glycine:cation symporter